MKINVNTLISEDHGDDIEITIKASQYTKELTTLIDFINNISVGELTTILGKNGNEISLISIDDIIYFYSEEQHNYCKTKKGIFSIKEKLYELEQKLPQKKFIRISNSSIVNINHVNSFDVGIVGSILVKFTDNSTQYVSRRRVSNVMKFLKGE